MGPQFLGGSAYPWPGFFLERMRDFIMKEETVAGIYGIETRFPFLDPEVVQEWLWLSPELKNSEYKRPLADFMRREGYPLLLGKRGFSVIDHDSTEDFDSSSTEDFDSRSTEDFDS